MGVKNLGKLLVELTGFVKQGGLFPFFQLFLDSVILQSVWYVNNICFWRGCASHVERCALVSKQTCLAWLSFNLTECSTSEKICYFLISIASIIHWQFCRYQLGIIQGKWDQLQLDNELPHKTLEELTGDFFFLSKPCECFISYGWH